MKFHIWSGSHIIKKSDFEKGLKSLQKLGFEYEVSAKVKNYSIKNQTPLLPFLAGSDLLKVQEFLKIADNAKANWLLASRGGYGCLRLLKLLDEAPMQRNQNLHVWGYSDLTVLQLYLWQRKGWFYVQGPLLGSDSLVKPKKEELNTLQNVAKFGIFPSQFKVKALNKHLTLPKSEPFLFLGGNLASIVSMLGTPWEPRPLQDFVLFLEDIDEAAYRTDRLLTQLKNSRFFDKCRGIVLGHFTKSPDYLKIFKALSTELRLPVYSGIPMGHQAPRIPLIMGKEIIFDGPHLLYSDASS
ncbi:MAG: LD-carboxypeptidase [Bdellovibrionota bacterium]